MSEPLVWTPESRARWDAQNAEMCLAACFYGIQLARADAVPLLGDVAELMRAGGLPPTHASVGGRGFGRKPLVFGRAFKRLQRADPADLDSIGAYHLHEGWTTRGDWRACSEIIHRLAYFDICLSLVAIPDAEERVEVLLGRWLKRLRPAYGIGLFRARGQHPEMYAIGLGGGSPLDFSAVARLETRATNAWIDGMKQAVYDQGILRDVYPLSLLTERHLQRPMDGGDSLAAWIARHPSHGTLSPCQPGYTLWRVAPERIPAVRKELAGRGALYVLDRENHL